MKEFKGTKGDWEAIKQVGYDYDVVCGDGEICWLGLTDVSNKEQEANAKLIAAAPILLKELQKVRLDIKLSGVFKEDSPIVQGIDQAIKKAID